MRELSFAQALNGGFEPREYKADVPVGTITARLDFRMWGKSVNLRCFFTNMKTSERFSLSPIVLIGASIITLCEKMGKFV